MVSASRRRAASVICALGMHALVACAQEDKSLTQLILVSDTDIVAIDSIELRVSSADRTDVPLAEATHVAGGEPAYVSLVRGEGSLGPITVSATGLSQGKLVLVRTHQVAFVPDQTRVVLLHLSASCLGPPATVCEPARQTCAETGCVEQTLDEGDLLPWTGTAPRLGGADAGLVDGGALPGSDARVEDGGALPVTDARVDDAATPPNLTPCEAGVFDTQNDVNHCGGCDIACTQVIPPNLHAVNICKAGLCAYACVSGWAGCDDKLENGCEADLTKPDRCGSCDSKCDKGQMCTNSMCVAPVAP